MHVAQRPGFQVEPDVGAELARGAVVLEERIREDSPRERVEEARTRPATYNRAPVLR